MTHTARRCLTAVALISSSAGATPMEWIGDAAVEGRFFFEPALLPEQPDRVNLAESMRLRGRWSNDEGLDIAIEPFLRLDMTDDHRSMVDLREALLTWSQPSVSLAAGVGQVFWGVTESRHLVNIVNQADVLDGPATQLRLGQPMLRGSVELGQGWGRLELLQLFIFREQAFPSSAGRPTFPVPVEQNATFESPLGRYGTDQVARYSNRYGVVEGGIYYFQGTSRQPEFNIVPPSSPSGVPSVRPHYPWIRQVALDLQVTLPDWLFKLESLVRSGQGHPFFATVVGVESSFYSVIESFDLGVLAEYNYDGRGGTSFEPLQNDAFFGFRVAANDVADTQALVGALVDLESAVTTARVELSRRFGETFRVELRGFGVAGNDVLDPVSRLRHDGFLELALRAYF